MQISLHLWINELNRTPQCMSLKFTHSSYLVVFFLSNPRVTERTEEVLLVCDQCFKKAPGRLSEVRRDPNKYF